jgi:uncharacterized membrane protein YhaH (DUF805 family)
MAYQDGTGDNLKLLMRTLNNSFDLSGRSRRTEVVYYWIASILANVVLVFSIISLLDFKGQIIGTQILRVILSIPAFALFVRRVHDQNRSAVWIIPFIAFVGLSIADGLRLLWDGAKPPFSGALAVVGLLLWMVCMILTFLPGTTGANQYGDDPRL